MIDFQTFEFTNLAKLILLKKIKSLNTLEIIGLVFSIYIIGKAMYHTICTAYYGWTHPM